MIIIIFFFIIIFFIIIFFIFFIYLFCRESVAERETHSFVPTIEGLRHRVTIRTRAVQPNFA
jgi:hypothetical protein